MVSQKRSLFISDRLQSALGRLGGFPEAGEKSDPGAQPGDAGTVTRRMNMLGDRYLSLLEDVAIELLLTRDELMRVGDVIGAPWTAATKKIQDLAHIISVANGFHIEDLSKNQSAPDYELICRIDQMTFLQKIAVVEWVERHWTPSVFDAPSTESAAPEITPQRLLRAIAMGILPSKDAANMAIKRLIKTGYTVDRAPFAHKCYELILLESMPTQEYVDKAQQEIGR